MLYLDGGWQTLVDGLRLKAEAAGVRIETREGVKTVTFAGDSVTGVALADGSRRPAAAVLLATGPRTASSLAGDPPALARPAAEALPAYAACLDVALARLPRPRTLFALGIACAPSSVRPRTPPGRGGPGSCGWPPTWRTTQPTD